MFNKPESLFTAGRVKILVIQPDGTYMAYGENPLLVGENGMNREDDRGRRYVKDFIDQTLKRGSYWFAYEEKNEYKLVYTQLVTLADGTVFIVGAGYWPHEKDHIIRELAMRAAINLEDSGPKAFADFINPGVSFLQGNSFVSVFTRQGLCLSRGPYGVRDIWRNFNRGTVQEKKFINVLTTHMKNGPGWFDYTLFGEPFHIYAQQVSYGGDELIIMSGFFSEGES